MKSFPVIAISGAVLGFILYRFNWLPATLMIVAPLMVFLIWIRPEYALYLFFALVIILTDAMSKDVQGIFAIKDVDLVGGLPPLLICFFLAIFFIYFFKLYFVERKKSLIPVRYGFVAIVILIIATGTGLWRASPPMDVRVDFYNVLFPVLCFYLCANALDSRQKVYRMLGILFVVGVIHACILDVYYLTGHGWPFQDDKAGLKIIVTKDPVDLMLFVAMTITIYSLSASRILTGWRRVLALIACMPMLFAILFSFRRSHWLGMIGALIVFFTLSSPFEKRKTLIWAWVGVVVLTAAILFRGDGASTGVLDPLGKRLLSLTDPRQPSVEHHLLEGQQTLKDLLSSPILGLGLGSRHSPVYGIDWAPEKQPTGIVHNTYLLIWMKLGLAGLFFFIWMAVKYVSVLLRYRRTTLSPYSGPIIAATGSTLGHWFVIFLTGPVLPYWYLTFAIALFATMVLTLIREEKLEESEENVNRGVQVDYALQQ